MIHKIVNYEWSHWKHYKSQPINDVLNGDNLYMLDPDVYLIAILDNSKTKMITGKKWTIWESDINSGSGFSVLALCGGFVQVSLKYGISHNFVYI